MMQKDQLLNLLSEIEKELEQLETKITEKANEEASDGLQSQNKSIQLAEQKLIQLEKQMEQAPFVKEHTLLKPHPPFSHLELRYKTS
ncbi:septation ring formation regulator EzrA [Bacillus pakistanensis]|uniref:Septation ring formation regulator EzrA n=1 Tax=Rossellomorea pakistanensis TaxID=992288 RepID=A0ABS2N9Q5_9BACI|nr:hypothetical protein [Bacillus pakistanensis]MBM7584306.1 septation ring formation regulator EzrA [Bacillus pakistanensis]